MKELFVARSTNGRWGLALVGPEETDLKERNTVKPVGTVSGVQVFEVSPTDEPTWVRIAGDVTVHGGATLVASVDLQSNGMMSLLLLGPMAVVEHHGYRRRTSQIVAYEDNVAVGIPSTVLAAMGLLKIDKPTDIVEPPPALEGAMAVAFALLRKPK